MEFYGRPLLTFIPTFLYFILVTIEGNKRKFFLVCENVIEIEILDYLYLNIFRR